MGLVTILEFDAFAQHRKNQLQVPSGAVLGTEAPLRSALHLYVENAPYNSLPSTLIRSSCSSGPIKGLMKS